MLIDYSDMTCFQSFSQQRIIGNVFKHCKRLNCSFDVLTSIITSGHVVLTARVTLS